MGSCLERESNMADTYGELSAPRPDMTVQFYGWHIFTTPPLIIPHKDFPLNCEQVCILCAKHLTASLGKFFPGEKQSKIGPKLLPLFGLYAADHSLQQWIPEAHVFDESTSNLKLYFRVKVRPARESIPEGLFVDYLFWQCAEDFLTGRVWTLFGMENKIRDVNDVNKYALWVFIASGRYLQERMASNPEAVLQKPLKEITRLDRIRGKVTLMNVHRLLPKKMSPELEKEYNIGDPFMRFLARRYLHSYIKDFFEKWGEENLSLIRQNFVEGFLTKVLPYYLLEFFPAEKVERHRPQRGNNGEDLGPLPSTSVELVIKPHQDGCVPGLYFNNKLKAHLRDIFGAEISDMRTENQKCRILLKIKHIQPMSLDMPNQASAKSFLSVLESYCRLKYNYYDSLNSECLAAPSLHVLQDLHCFGPMEEEEVRRSLQERKEKDERLAQCEAFYMLYQDTEDFNLLHATVLREEGETKEIETYNIRITADSSNGDRDNATLDYHFLVGNEEKTLTKSDLGFCLNTTLGLGRRLFPTDDNVCGAMQFLQDDHTSDCYYSYTGMENERAGKKRGNNTGDQPVVYREDQVAERDMERIARGEYSDVYRFKQMDLGREAILKKVTGKQQAVHDAYRQGAELLLKLHDRSPFFVRVYGFMISMPTRIIYECMPDGHGSLLQRLRDPDSPPLNWRQMASVLKQLAECLCYLKEAGIFYGNFCCAKILIRKETDQAITIRLGDPSLSLFYNTLPLNDIQNDNRLAWLAPERWKDLGGEEKPLKPTLESEVYSLGTTIWEIVSGGLDPRQCIPYSVKTRDFFAQGKKLPDPQVKKDSATPGDVASIPVAGGRTEQWVNNQDFTATSTSGGDDESQGAMPSYNRVAVADSAQGSTLASGDTEVTGLSAAPADPKEQSPDGNSEKDAVCKIQERVLKLMHDCWHSEPHQRPAPVVLLKAASDVEEMAEKVATSCPLWHRQLLLQIALETGIIQDREKVQKLKQQVEQAQATSHADQTEENLTDVLNILDSEVRKHIDSAIDHTLLQPTGTKLGEGQFGEVKEAYLQEASETRAAAASAKKEKVAVKRMKTEQTSLQIAQFLREVLNVFKLEHRNVVKLKGVVMKGHDIPYQLVMEFADRGTLERYVKDNFRRLGCLDFKKELHAFSIDIAEGMKYICETETMIHGDLAARNVLLFSTRGREGASLTAKLSDFGLSHKLARGQRGIFYYDLKKSKVGQSALPVFGMPPEIIENWNTQELKFTMKTDVWSFGVTLWEMFSGHKPESKLNKKNLKDTELIAELNKIYREGYMLDQPVNCPPKVYAIMKLCWKRDDTARPDFSSLLEIIRDLMDNELDA